MTNSTEGFAPSFVSQTEVREALKQDSSEQELRLQQALIPNSFLDKLAQKWTYSSSWVKGAVVLGTTLAFGLLGLAFGASILLSFISLVIGLIVHNVLVTHQEARVKRIMNLVKEQEAIGWEDGFVFKPINVESLDFSPQKLDIQSTCGRLEYDAPLTYVETVINDQGLTQTAQMAEHLNAAIDVGYEQSRDPLFIDENSLIARRETIQKTKEIAPQNKERAVQPQLEASCRFFGLSDQGVPAEEVPQFSNNPINVR